MRREPSKRLAELDGLRALAILPVIFNHVNPTEGWWRWTSVFGQAGWMGVDLFFILSGYLITGILLDTVDGKHYYRNFIVRRTIRIFPLYYLCLVIFTLSIRLSASSREAMNMWGGAGWFFAYLGNIRSSWTNVMPPVFSFGPLWSLQIEEQFYLFYPIVVLCLSRSNLRRFLISCVVAAPLLRVSLLLFSTNTGVARYVLTPCRMDSLALGGLVALLVRSPWRSTLTFAQASAWALAAATGTFLVCAVTGPDWGSPLMSTVGYTLVDITCALLLTLVVLWPSSPLAKWLRWRPLVYTGTIAYGLYLLHGPASWLMRSLIGRVTGFQIGGHSLLSVPITYVSAYIAAGLSWHFFESPILRLKAHFSGQSATEESPAGGRSALPPHRAKEPVAASKDW
ncbi:MAG TPA: acyltransferase [Bryobacteraceae bacterium]|nr:acyltransferase [Bryobacteraceae bacterium]